MERNGGEIRCVPAKSRGKRESIEAKPATDTGLLGDMAVIGQNAVTDVNHGGHKPGFSQCQSGSNPGSRVEKAGEKMVVPFDSAQGTAYWPGRVWWLSGARWLSGAEAAFQ